MAFPRRRIVQTVAALVAIALLIASGLFVREVIRARARLTQAEAKQGKRVAPDPPRLDVRQKARAAAPMDTIPLGAPIAAAGDDPVNVAKATANEYRQRARYPRWSQPFDGPDDPLLTDEEGMPVSTTDGTEPTLTVFPLRQTFEAPESVTLLAHLTSAGGRIPGESIHGTVLDDEQQVIREIKFNDEGREGDEQAGDLLYTARITDLPSPTAAYKAKVVAIVSAAERTAVASFVYGRPDAQLTGKYRDAAAEGDLTLDAEVDVSAAGRFHIEATLYDSDGKQPVAWAQHTAELPTGKQWLQLRFYGLVLRERGIDGPYLVRSVALSTLTRTPAAKNRVVTNPYVTARYAASSFSDKPFDDPDLLEAADRIEQAIDGLKPGAGS